MLEVQLSRVSGVIDEAMDFLANQGQASTTSRCLNGAFLNLVSWHQLSRKAKKMAKNIVAKIQESEKFQKISYGPIQRRSIETKGYEVFESRKLTLRRIMEAFRDPNTMMVGMYEMAGVGKNMLAKEVARQAMEENLLSEVVWTTVSQNLSYENIQQELGDNLGMEFHEKNLSARAN